MGEYLILGPGEMKSGGHRRESILADAVEALIGAIYLDAGMDCCKQRVLQWFSQRLEAVSPDENIKDAKTQLQEWLQGRKKTLPQYELSATSGAEHNQVFKVACCLPDFNQSFFGEASSRKAAEQLAAQSALEYLQSKS